MKTSLGKETKMYANGLGGMSKWWPLPFMVKHLLKSTSEVVCSIWDIGPTKFAHLVRSNLLPNGF